MLSQVFNFDLCSLATFSTQSKSSHTLQELLQIFYLSQEWQPVFTRFVMCEQIMESLQIASIQDFRKRVSTFHELPTSCTSRTNSPLQRWVWYSNHLDKQGFFVCWISMQPHSHVLFRACPLKPFRCYNISGRGAKGGFQWKLWKPLWMNLPLIIKCMEHTEKQLTTFNQDSNTTWVGWCLHSKPFTEICRHKVGCDNNCTKSYRTDN